MRNIRMKSLEKLTFQYGVKGDFFYQFYAVLWIRVGSVRIRIRTQGFDDQNLDEQKFKFFWSELQRERIKNFNL